MIPPSLQRYRDYTIGREEKQLLEKESAVWQKDAILSGMGGHDIIKTPNDGVRGKVGEGMKQVTVFFYPKGDSETLLRKAAPPFI